MKYLNAQNKRWIAVVSTGVLAIAQLPALYSKLPQFLSKVAYGTFTWIQVVAVVGLVSAYWVATKSVD